MAAGEFPTQRSPHRREGVRHGSKRSSTPPTFDQLLHLLHLRPVGTAAGWKKGGGWAPGIPMRRASAEEGGGTLAGGGECLSKEILVVPHPSSQEWCAIG